MTSILCDASEKKNVINIENIAQDIISRGCFEYYEPEGDRYKLTIKGYLVLFIILNEIELDPDVSVKDVRHNLKIMLKHMECTIQSYNSIIYEPLKTISNFDIDSGYVCGKGCTIDEIELDQRLGDVFECVSIDFFVNKITKKFNYGGECIVGLHSPIEGEVLFENVTENSVLTETAVNVGVLTYHIEQVVQSLDDVLD